MAFNIGTTLNLLSSLLGGSSSKSKTQIVLSCNGERAVIPVPATWEMSDGQNHKSVNILSYGDATVLGNKKRREVKWSSFFPNPNREYPFVIGDKKTPTEFVELFKKWKESKTPIRLIITDSPINMMCAIGDFNTKIQEYTGDIYYDIQLLEYPDLNTPTANNEKEINDATGLKERSDITKTASKTQTTLAKARDVVDTAKQYYGKAEHWRRVAQSNNLQTLVINNYDNLKGLKL